MLNRAYSRAMENELQRLVTRRSRLAVVLTALMTVAYFGFILLVAFDQETAGTLILDGRVSIGIVLGAALIVLAPVLIAIYVRWTNRIYDPAIQQLRNKREDGAS